MYKQKEGDPHWQLTIINQATYLVLYLLIFLNVIQYKVATIVVTTTTIRYNIAKKYRRVTTITIRLITFTITDDYL